MSMQHAKPGHSRTASISAAVLALVLAVAVPSGFAGAYADEAGRDAAAAEPGIVDAAVQEMADAFIPHGSDYGKNETVAVKTDLSGRLDSMSVEEWVKNPLGLESLADVSTLQDIVPDGDALAFTREGDSLTWQTGGGDVAYTGTTDRELPFSISYAYRLDGEEVDPATLRGVEGTLEVRISYENNTSGTVSTASGAYDIQDPFVMASIISFDSEHARDVSVDNGAVIDRQGTFMAVGLGMPGLADTLGVADAIELPSDVTITAEVRGFDMPDITTIVTDQALGMVDAGKTGDAREKLSDALGQLGNLSTGAEMLAKGNAGVAQATGKIAEGQAAMAENLPAATDGLTALADTAGAASETVTAAAEAQAGAAENTAASLEAQQRALEQQQAALDALEAQAGGAGADAGLADAKAALEALRGIDVAGLDADQEKAVRAAMASLESSISAAGAAAAPAPGDARASIEAAMASTRQSMAALGENAESAPQLAQGLMMASKQTEGLSRGLAGATEGLGKVQEGTLQLSQALSQVSEASDKLSQASSKMSAGVDEALSTARSTVDEKVDLINALREYVESKPAFGGSAPGMPASTMYLVHAKSEPTPLR